MKLYQLAFLFFTLAVDRLIWSYIWGPCVWKVYKKLWRCYEFNFCSNNVISQGVSVLKATVKQITRMALKAAMTDCRVNSVHNMAGTHHFFYAKLSCWRKILNYKVYVPWQNEYPHFLHLYPSDNRPPLWARGILKSIFCLCQRWV